MPDATPTKQPQSGSDFLTLQRARGARPRTHRLAHQAPAPGHRGRAVAPRRPTPALPAACRRPRPLPWGRRGGLPPVGGRGPGHHQDRRRILGHPRSVDLHSTPDRRQRRPVAPHAGRGRQSRLARALPAAAPEPGRSPSTSRLACRISRPSLVKPGCAPSARSSPAPRQPTWGMATARASPAAHRDRGLPRAVAGVRADADAVLVVAGVAQALALLCQVLSRSGAMHSVALEDPDRGASETS